MKKKLLALVLVACAAESSLVATETVVYTDTTEAYETARPACGFLGNRCGRSVCRPRLFKNRCRKSVCCRPRVRRNACCAPRARMCRPKRMSCPRIRCCAPKPVCCPQVAPACPTPACVTGDNVDVMQPAPMEEMIVEQAPMEPIEAAEEAEMVEEVE